MIDISSREDIARIIGFDTIESDELGKAGDRLYFDEDCFVRGSSGRFQLEHLAPVAGKAVIVGSPDGGHMLSVVSKDMENLRSSIKYV